MLSQNLPAELKTEAHSQIVTQHLNKMSLVFI